MVSFGGFVSEFVWWSLMVSRCCLIHFFVFLVCFWSVCGGSEVSFGGVLCFWGGVLDVLRWFLSSVFDWRLRSRPLQRLSLLASESRFLILKPSESDPTLRRMSMVDGTSHEIVSFRTRFAHMEKAMYGISKKTEIHKDYVL